MSEHGTNARYVAGCRCDECRAATRYYHKRLMLDHLRGIRRLVDATGVRRRIEALGYLGWTGVQIGDRLGASGEHVRQLRSQRWVTRDLHARMVAAYDELSMSLPPETTRAERHNASRQRTAARRNGWLPPLVWDEGAIDDPTAEPSIGRDPHHYLSEELVSEWRWLESAGESIDQAARQLGVTVGAIEKALERVGKAVA